MRHAHEGWSHATAGGTLNELCEHLDMTRPGVTRHPDLLEAANRRRAEGHLQSRVPVGNGSLAMEDPYPSSALR
jgi:hypothetical protein